MNNTLTKSQAKSPAVIFLHCLLLCFPALTLVSNSGTGFCSFAFLLLAILYHKAGGAALGRHLNEIRWVLTAFGLAFLFALSSLLLHPELQLRWLEKPSRMLAAASVLLVVLALRPRRRLFWHGLILGAIAGAAFIGYQRWGLGMERPGGLINAITYGDLMLAVGLMCLAGTLDFRGRWLWWPALGVLAGLVGSVATGTRGGWLGALLALPLLLYYGRHMRGSKVLAIGGAVLVLLTAVYLIPQTGLRERVAEGVNDVSSYYNGGNAFTNVGVRLELWKGAGMLISRHPWSVSSPQQMRQGFEQAVAEHRLEPFVLQFEHVHNDALQAAVYGGLPGMLIWASTLVLPLLFFLHLLRSRDADRSGVTPLALAGLLLVVGYFSFGLTEVIFWTMRSSLFYAMMLFLIMGLCLNAKAGHD
ncbi:O-antigen ligase [Massilia sp. BJB1822]|uniref:O-antigen ligase family protein n=1 Tax=Massilia sp. BJB1822 TaxID=2744470 RepID=UPI00159350D6|nr:O-antigen ligase family protein [Massilia sp. BJB1822]NVE01383.1 O-antigen ligase family protein [Massilia sp. BJB1822]